jgi:hypothetical protein
MHRREAQNTKKKKNNAREGGTSALTAERACCCAWHRLQSVQLARVTFFLVGGGGVLVLALGCFHPGRRIGCPMKQWLCTDIVALATYTKSSKWNDFHYGKYISTYNKQTYRLSHAVSYRIFGDMGEREVRERGGCFVKQLLCNLKFRTTEQLIYHCASGCCYATYKHSFVVYTN